MNLFKDHPKALPYLFFTEMWERFSFYGMKSLLILYMYDSFSSGETASVLGHNFVTGSVAEWFHLSTKEQIISQIYGLYFAFIWATPMFGGLIADITKKRSAVIVVGCLLMCIGHFSFLYSHLFYVSLSLVICGSGLFKSNLPAQLAEIYPEGDRRVESAYTLSYAGICIGAFTAPIVCGALAQRYGWHIGFSVAGLGMVVGGLTYLLGLKHFTKKVTNRGINHVTDQITDQVIDQNVLIDVPQDLAIQRPDISKYSVPKINYVNYIKLFLLFFITGIYWALFEQQGNSLQLYVDKYIQWNIFSFKIPSVWFQSIGSFMIVVITPVVLSFLTKRGSEKKYNRVLLNMSYGSLLMSVAILSFAILPFSTQLLGLYGQLMWLPVFALSIAFSEILFSPGIAVLISQTVKKSHLGFFMGLSGISGVIGSILGGYLGGLYHVIELSEFLYILSALGVFLGVLLLGAYKLRVFSKHTHV